MVEALGIDLKEFIFYLINFVILIGILAKFLYKPFLKILDERRQKIQDALDSAEAMNRRADEKMDAYTKRIANVESEGREIIREAKSKADQEARAILDDAGERASKMITDARDEIERDKARAREDMKGEIKDLALLAASKILEEEIAPNERQEQIVDQILKEQGEGKWAS
ncbi:MAG: F0F1 ATP synthase subunit B [Firmicutes bacterium]|nr:F0F1 ATP synthase subunit B [Bacillota bacterium]MBQ3964910.1 F0F1 ATP synthase subunit B [Bacillota bacterium]